MTPAENFSLLKKQLNDSSISKEEILNSKLLDELNDSVQYRTIDLFAGIGGIRLGFEQTGKIKTVFSCEIDKNAAKVYKGNFGDDSLCDINCP